MATCILGGNKSAPGCREQGGEGKTPCYKATFDQSPRRLRAPP